MKDYEGYAISSKRIETKSVDYIAMMYKDNETYDNIKAAITACFFIGTIPTDVYVALIKELNEKLKPADNKKKRGKFKWNSISKR